MSVYYTAFLSIYFWTIWFNGFLKAELIFSQNILAFMQLGETSSPIKLRNCHLTIKKIDLVMSQLPDEIVDFTKIKTAQRVDATRSSHTAIGHHNCRHVIRALMVFLCHNSKTCLFTENSNNSNRLNCELGNSTFVFGYIGLRCE